MKTYVFTYFALLFLMLGEIVAQDKIRVVDKVFNFPMEGVSISANKKNTITDKDGFFYISKLFPLESVDTISISFIGYRSQKITKAEIIDKTVYMTPEAISIDEITVTRNRDMQESVPFEELASLKHGVFAFGSTLVGDSIYVVGGDATVKDEYGLKYLYEHNRGIIQTYDIKNNRWSILDTKVSNRAYHNIHYSNGKIFILGGKRHARNTRLEYLNDKVEVYDIKRDTVYSSNSNPHQAINFASGIYNGNIIVMNGSVKQNHHKKKYTNEVHLFDTKTGIWYKLDNIPYSYETTGIVVDSILYQIGGFNNKNLPFINTYNIATGEHRTQAVSAFCFGTPALAYNPEEKVIYIFEAGALFSYNILTDEIYGYKVNLMFALSGMIYKDNYLYIIGGQEYFDNISSSSKKLYRINIKDLEQTQAYKIGTRPKINTANNLKKGP